MQSKYLGLKRGEKIAKLYHSESYTSMIILPRAGDIEHET